jgi:hypothetical protein
VAGNSRENIYTLPETTYTKLKVWAFISSQYLFKKPDLYAWLDRIIINSIHTRALFVAGASQQQAFQKLPLR